MKPRALQTRRSLSNAEEDEVVREVEGDPTDPKEARDLEDMIIRNPRNEEATEEQLKRQMITNAESTDPTTSKKPFAATPRPTATTSITSVRATRLADRAAMPRSK